MLSPGSPSLEIERSTRSQYVVVTTVLAILAMVPWWLPISLGTAALLAIFACALASLNFWYVGWLGGKRRFQKALWSGDGGWRIFDSTGASWPATLDPRSQIMGSWLWLRFDSERGARAMVLFGSDLSPDARRRLIARLRLEAAQTHAGSGQLP